MARRRPGRWFELYQSPNDSKHYWRVNGINGKRTADGSEGYNKAVDRDEAVADHIVFCVEASGMAKPVEASLALELAEAKGMVRRVRVDKRGRVIRDADYRRRYERSRR